MLITGVYRGVGKEIVKYFANLGVNIIMTYHNKMNETKKLEREISAKYHINIESYYLDLSNEKSVNELYKYVKNKYKKI